MMATEAQIAAVQVSSIGAVAKRDEGSANVAGTRKPRRVRTRPTRSRRKADGLCYACGAAGHFASLCPFRTTERGRSSLPLRDDDSIARLNRLLGGQKAWATVRGRKAERVLASLAPLHQLPWELLALITQYAASPDWRLAPNGLSSGEPSDVAANGLRLVYRRPNTHFAFATGTCSPASAPFSVRMNIGQDGCFWFGVCHPDIPPKTVALQGSIASSSFKWESAWFLDSTGCFYSGHNRQWFSPRPLISPSDRQTSIILRVKLECAISAKLWQLRIAINGHEYRSMPLMTLPPSSDYRPFVRLRGNGSSATVLNDSC